MYVLREGAMPTFYFDLWDGHRIEFDDTGIELGGLEAAFEEAVRGARDMLHAAALKRRLVTGWAYQVRDETGKTLFTVPFAIAPVDRHYARA